MKKPFLFLVVLLLAIGCSKNSSSYKEPYKNKIVVSSGKQLIYIINPLTDKLIGKVVSGDAPESFLYKNNKLFVLNVGYSAGTPTSQSLTVFKNSGESKNYKLNGRQIASSNISSKIYGYEDGNIIFAIDSKTQKINKFSENNYFFLGFMNAKGKALLAALDENQRNILIFKTDDLKPYKRLALNPAKLKINYESSDKQIYQLNNDIAVLVSGQKQTAVMIDLQQLKTTVYKKFPIADLSEILPIDQPRAFVYKNKLYSVRDNHLYSIDALGNIESKTLPVKANNVIRSLDNKVVFLNIEYKTFPFLKQAYLYDLGLEKIVSEFNADIQSDDFALVREKLYVTESLATEDLDKGAVHVLDFKTKKQKKIKTGGTPGAIYYTGE